MPSTVACLHHLARPVLGWAGAALREAGIELDERDLPAGDELPRVDEVAGIVAFGGEQSVRELERYPYLVAEAALLREAVAREVPVFGICLGGQLLSHALGGSVSRLPRPLLEWSRIDPLPAAAADPVFASFAAGAAVLHWNEDAFTLPPGSVELTTRSGSAVEAFRAGSRAWGIQFHPEVDEEDLDHWYAISPSHPQAAGVDEADARAEDSRRLPAQRELGRALFDAFARVVAG